MNNYDLISKLKEVGISVPVKIEINGILYNIKDVVWAGLQNEGCYKITLKHE